MRVYLATFEIVTGEYSYLGYFLLQAATQARAWKVAQTQEHEADSHQKRDHLSYWDHGDGGTAARLERVTEVSDQEAETIWRHGLADYL
jgi:hypothetical protein